MSMGLRQKAYMNHKGVYLTEVVFSVVLISLILFLTPFVRKNICDIKIKYFINSLNNDINYGLEYSITHFNLVKIKFYPNNHLYKMTDGNASILKEKKYDKSLVIDSYITYDVIEITHGYVNDYNYFYLSCGNIKYKINIYEKSGIINVSK